MLQQMFFYIIVYFAMHDQNVKKYNLIEKSSEPRDEFDLSALEKEFNELACLSVKEIFNEISINVNAYFRKMLFLDKNFDSHSYIKNYGDNCLHKYEFEGITYRIFPSNSKTIRNHSQLNFLGNILQSVQIDTTNKVVPIYVDSPIDLTHIKIAFVCSGPEATEECIYETINGENIIVFKSKGNKTNIINTIKACIDKFDLIVCSEMSGNEEIDEEIANLKPKKSLIIGPGFHMTQDGKQKSVYTLIRPNIQNLKFPKNLPYITKYDGKIITYRENIECGDKYLVLNFNNFGRFLIVICSDYFNDEIRTIVHNMNIDVVICLSNTDRFKRFDNESSSLIVNEKRIFIQINHCENCLKDKAYPMNINPKRFCEKLDCKKKCSVDPCYYEITIEKTIESFEIVSVDKFPKNEEEKIC